MELNLEAVKIIVQIIPIMLLATYFDRDAMHEVQTRSNKHRLYWAGSIIFILIAEGIGVLMLTGADFTTNAVSESIVLMATFLCIANLGSITMWRLYGFDLVTGTRSKK